MGTDVINIYIYVHEILIQIAISVIPFVSNIVGALPMCWRTCFQFIPPDLLILLTELIVAELSDKIEVIWKPWRPTLFYGPRLPVANLQAGAKFGL